LKVISRANTASHMDPQAASSTAPHKADAAAELQSPQSKASEGVYQPLYSEDFYLYSFKASAATQIVQGPA
jgi:hypothetical protein